ncbi:MAG TPA: glycosyltransferase [Blastocatellia bacterium]|nr:glycosyltransferase [Blastocatellia bacterium]
MQRILHFAQDGDTSGFFPQLARWHDRSCYQMFFATLNPIAPWLRDYMQSQGVECFSCDCTTRVQYLLGMIRLAGFLRRKRVDILHTHLFEPSVIGLQAGVLARTPVRVTTRHYSDYHTRINKKWHVRLDQLCTRLSHAVIAVSQHTADHLIQEEGAPAGKVYAVLNGIDFDRAKLSDVDARERLRNEFAAAQSHLLLIVARLHPEKGHHYLFQALPDIQRRVNRPVRLLVAGTGPFEAAYREEVRASGCEDIVSFLGFRKDSPDLMAAADLLILPSVAEAFGLALTEALYLRTPVVATRVGGIPEIVDDGVDGILVPPADSKALADAIVDLLNDQRRRQRMAGAGRDKVLTRFSFEDMVRSYETIYEKAVAGSRADKSEELHAAAGS